jgi:hypothetical protein
LSVAEHAYVLTLGRVAVDAPAASVTAEDLHVAYLGAR